MKKLFTTILGLASVAVNAATLYPPSGGTVYSTNLPAALQPLVTNNAVNLTNIQGSNIVGVAAGVYSNQTLTIAGTANQVISSVGAQDFTANRTVTLSTPQDINITSAVQHGRLGLGVAPDATVPLSIYEAIATASGASGIQLSNLNPATVGSQAYSPFIRLAGAGWKTASTAGSQPVWFDIGVVPVQGSANPTAMLVISNSINGATFTEVMRIDSAGNWTTANGNVTLNNGTLSAANATLSGGGQIYYSGRGYIITYAGGLFVLEDNSGNTNVGVVASGLFLGGDKTAALVRDSASTITATNLTASSSYATLNLGGAISVGTTNYVAGSIRHDGGTYVSTNMQATANFNKDWSMTNVAASYTMALPIGVDTTLLMFQHTLYTVTNSAGSGTPITITIPAGFKKSSWWGTNVSAVVVTNATMAWVTCRPGETNIYWEQGY